MKRKASRAFIYLPLFLLGLVLCITPVYAAELVWNGSLETETRFSLSDEQELTMLEANLRFQPEVTADYAHFYAELRYRIPGLRAAVAGTEPNAGSQAQLSFNGVNPAQLEINEAYLDLYGFPHKAIDLRIGKQLISWGTGYLLNPTNNLNPEDFRDIFNFGQYLGTQAIKATAFLGDFTLTGIYLPAFAPAALPATQDQSLFTPTFPTFPFPTNEPVVKTVIPGQKPGGWGFKLDKSLFGLDFSLSYVEGRYTLPVPKVTLTPQEGSVNVLCELIFPTRKILGFDLAGSYGDLGFWGEMAVFFPEEVKTTWDLTPLIGQKLEITTLEKKAYQKYLIGLDYAIGSFYANLQYLYGFPQEMGADNLGSYFISCLEWTLGDGKVKIPFNTCLEVRDFNNFGDNHALIYQPQLCLYPEMNTEIILGVRVIDGQPGTTLGRLKDLDAISLKVKYSF
mgnify:CR=1 FL=1